MQLPTRISRTGCSYLKQMAVSHLQLTGDVSQAETVSTFDFREDIKRILGDMFLQFILGNKGVTLAFVGKWHS